MAIRSSVKTRATPDAVLASIRALHAWRVETHGTSEWPSEAAGVRVWRWRNWLRVTLRHEVRYRFSVRQRPDPVVVLVRVRATPERGSRVDLRCGLLGAAPAPLMLVAALAFLPAGGDAAGPAPPRVLAALVATFYLVRDLAMTRASEPAAEFLMRRIERAVVSASSGTPVRRSANETSKQPTAARSPR